ncbi:MAG: hypothetical protein ACLQVM_13960 [Terriglobia bacterium]
MSAFAGSPAITWSAVAAATAFLAIALARLRYETKAEGGSCCYRTPGPASRVWRASTSNSDPQNTFDCRQRLRCLLFAGVFRHRANRIGRIDIRRIAVERNRTLAYNTSASGLQSKVMTAAIARIRV